MLIFGGCELHGGGQVLMVGVRAKWEFAVGCCFSLTRGTEQFPSKCLVEGGQM